jgi:Zinc finger, ZZ type
MSLSTASPCRIPFQVDDYSSSSSSLSQTPTTCALAGRVTAFGSATQVPPNDVGRLSYYLKCCVLGCGITLNHMSLDLLDYVNARSLSPLLQQRIFRLAFGEFRLEMLLNRTIFVDDERTLLSADASNVFFSVQTPLDMATLGRLGGSLLGLPQEQVMLCTTAWLNEFYVAPFLRFVQRSTEEAVLGPTPMNEASMDSLHEMSFGNTSASASARSYCQPVHSNILCDHCKCQGIRGARYRCTTCEDYDLCERCYHHGSQEHTHTFERITFEGSTPVVLDEARPSRKAGSKAGCGSNRKRTLEEWDLCSNKTMGEDSDDEHIPMVMALPIQEEETCCTSASCGKKKRRRTTPVEDSTATFVPGQPVRLTGLAATQMNERLAVVQERIHGRVIVRVDNHDRPFSVKPENLIVVETGGVLVQ